MGCKLSKSLTSCFRPVDESRNERRFRFCHKLRHRHQLCRVYPVAAVSESEAISGLPVVHQNVNLTTSSDRASPDLTITGKSVSICPGVLLDSESTTNVSTSSRVSVEETSLDDVNRESLAPVRTPMESIARKDQCVWKEIELRTTPDTPTLWNAFCPAGLSSTLTESGQKFWKTSRRIQNIIDGISDDSSEDESPVARLTTAKKFCIEEENDDEFSCVLATLGNPEDMVEKRVPGCHAIEKHSSESDIVNEESHASASFESATMPDLRLHLSQTRPGAAKGKRSRPDPIQAAIDGCIIQVSSSDEDDPLGLDDNQGEFSPRVPPHTRVPLLSQQWQAHGLKNFHNSTGMVRANDDFVSNLRSSVQKDASDRGRGRQRSNAVNRQRSQAPTGRHQGHSTPRGRNEKTHDFRESGCREERSRGSLTYRIRYCKHDVKSSSGRAGEVSRRTTGGQSNGQSMDNAEMWYYENRNRMSRPRKGNESKELTRDRLQTWLTNRQGEEGIPGMTYYDEADDVIPREGIG